MVLKGKTTRQSRCPPRKLIPNPTRAPLLTPTAKQLYLSSVSLAITLPELFQVVYVFGFNCPSISAILPGFLGILAVFT